MLCCLECAFLDLFQALLTGLLNLFDYLLRGLFDFRRHLFDDGLGALGYILRRDACAFGHLVARFAQPFIFLACVRQHQSNGRAHPKRDSAEQQGVVTDSLLCGALCIARIDLRLMAHLSRLLLHGSAHAACPFSHLMAKLPRLLLYSSTHAACTFSHLVAELPRLALGFTAERSRRILDSATDLRSGLAYGVGRACDLVLRSL